MSKTSLIEKYTEEQLAEELLLRSVVDFEFRSEFLVDIDPPVLPLPISPQDMSFTEIVKGSLSAEACQNTCISGFTIQCDGTSLDSTPDCRSTCITGYTIRCDGRTL